METASVAESIEVTIDSRHLAHRTRLRPDVPLAKYRKQLVGQRPSNRNCQRASPVQNLPKLWHVHGTPFGNPAGTSLDRSP